MRILRWLVGAVLLVGIIVLVVLRPVESRFFEGGTEHSEFAARIVYILILSALMVLWRVLRGPTAADRIVAIDILGILIVGLCAMLSIATGKSWYIDIGIAWGLQSFIGTLALAKYLEGRRFDD